MHSFLLLPVLGLAASPAWSACDEQSSSVSSATAHVVASASGGDGASEQSVGVGVVNGKVSVTLNGKSVPDSRLKRDGARLIILDERGKPIADMPFIQIESDGNGQDARVIVRSTAGGGGAKGGGGASAGGSAGASSGATSSSSPSMEAMHKALMEAASAGSAAAAHGQQAWTEAQKVARAEALNAGDLVKRYLSQVQRTMEGDATTATVVVQAPKVMLGVNLGEADEALLKQLRLDPGSATVLESVKEGLPASKAGLETLDLVVEVDGQRPASPTLIRKLLSTKNPGDPLRLVVVRDGARQQFEVKLEAYDPVKLGNEMKGVPVEGQDAKQDPVAGQDGMWQGLNVQIEPYLLQLRDSLRFAPLPRDPNAPVDPAAPRDFVYELRLPGGGDAGSPNGVDAAQRLDRLEKRLDEMSRKLERLLEKLDRHGG